MKNFRSVKDDVKRLRRPAETGRKYLERHLIKDYYPKYMSNFKNSTINKQLKNEPKILADSSSKKIHRRQITIWNDAPHHMSLWKSKIKTVRYHYTPIRMSKSLEPWPHQGLAGMWTSRRLPSLLAVMQRGTATSEDNLAVSYKVNILASNCTPWHLPKWTGNFYPHKNLHIDVYSSFIHNCPNLEATKMSSNRCGGRLWHIQTISVLRRNELRSCEKTWGNLKRIWPSERSQSEKATWFQLCGIVERAKLWRQ